MKLNRTKVSLSLFAAGYCTHPEFITMRGGSLRQAEFPAGFACIHHPTIGPILFDTGYASRFYTETKRFPYSLYARITPAIIQEEDSAVQQLARIGIDASEVRMIIVSHFHADHIAGLKDFTNAKFIYTPEAYDAVHALRGFSALRKGFVPTLLPVDFEARSLPLHHSQKIRLPNVPFKSGFDICGDGSIIAVHIPGHAAGQIGIFVETDNHPYFLCADAVWSSRAYREHRLPHPIASLIMPSRKQYKTSFKLLIELHQLYPELRIIPAHCTEMRDRFIKGDELL